MKTLLATLLFATLSVSAQAATQFRVVCLSYFNYPNYDDSQKLTEIIQTIPNVLAVSTPAIISAPGADRGGICVTVQYQP
jgi:hypothetical protein